MNLSDTGAGNIYLRELSGVLRRAGLDTQSAENGVLPVSLGGEPLCVVTENGGVRYKMEDIDSAAKDEACDRVVEISQTVTEYMNIMKSSPPLIASGLAEEYSIYYMHMLY